MPSVARKRVALVTGAGRGVGRATAIALAHKGFALALAARTFEELRETRRLCEIASHDSLVVLADLALDDGPAQLMGAALAHYGRLDALINGARAAASDHSILDLRIADPDRLLAVNLRAPIALARMAALQMRAQAAGGTIINFASDFNGSVDPVTAAADAGIFAFSRTAATALRSDQIKIAAIAVRSSDHGLTAGRAVILTDRPYEGHAFDGTLGA